MVTGPWPVLVRGRRVGPGDGVVVDGLDRDGDAGRVRAAVPVGNDVVERGGAVVVGVGREDGLAVHDRDRTVRRAAHALERERVAVNIRVVGDDINRDGHVLVGRRGVRAGDGVVVDGG